MYLCYLLKYIILNLKFFSLNFVVKALYYTTFLYKSITKTNKKELMSSEVNRSLSQSNSFFSSSYLSVYLMDFSFSFTHKSLFSSLDIPLTSHNTTSPLPFLGMSTCICLLLPSFLSHPYVYDLSQSFLIFTRYFFV